MILQPAVLSFNPSTNMPVVLFITPTSKLATYSHALVQGVPPSALPPIAPASAPIAAAPYDPPSHTTITSTP
jgi:hypothetical protein